MSLGFHNVNHRYGSNAVLHDISLTANTGDILCLLGPSGGGKSTLLRLAAGLETLQSGRITLADRLLADPQQQPPPEQRPIGLVFQDHVLFPHLDVARNVGFGLQALSKDQRDARVRKHLAGVGLSGFGARYPHTLSGGQQQRVALARALATEPAVMLLDEPFAAVDSTLRRALRRAARDVLKASGTTTIVVTHDPDEAMALADQIAIMVDGRIQQQGTPAEIWQTPNDRVVALLFGDAQRVTGRLHQAEAICDFGCIPYSAEHTTLSPSEPAAVDIIIRPNAVRVKAAERHPPEVLDQQSPHTGRAQVKDIRFIGAQYQLTLTSESDPALELLARIEDPGAIAPGTTVRVALDPSGAFAFPAPPTTENDPLHHALHDDE